MTFAGIIRTSVSMILRRNVSVLCSVKDDQNGNCVSVRSISMAAMLTAAVVTAGVTFLAMLVVMVITVNIGVVAQTSAEQCVHRSVSVPADTAVELDTCFGECCLCTVADASANQSVHAVLHQEACQCAVTASVGIDLWCVTNPAAPWRSWHGYILLCIKSSDT